MNWSIALRLHNGIILFHLFTGEHLRSVCHAMSLQVFGLYLEQYFIPRYWNVNSMVRDVSGVLSYRINSFSLFGRNRQHFHRLVYLNQVTAAGCNRQDNEIASLHFALVLLPPIEELGTGGSSVSDFFSRYYSALLFDFPLFSVWLGHQGGSRTSILSQSCLLTLCCRECLFKGAPTTCLCAWDAGLFYQGQSHLCFFHPEPNSFQKWHASFCYLFECI